MALLRHILAILLTAWTILSAVNCLAVPSSNENTGTAQHKNNTRLMPEEIVLTLTTKNETITLNLTRNTNIPSDVPVVVAANGTQTTWKPNSDRFAVYFEMHSSASIVIEMKIQNGQQIKNCRGILSIKGTHYSVQPVENNSRDHSSEEFLVDIDGVDHVMKVEDTELDFADPIHSSSSHRNNVNRINDTDMFDWPSGLQQYVVEMAIFVDYVIYNRWYSRSLALDHNGRDYDARRNIQYYFVQVANGVDMRYSTIQERDFSIRVRLVGIYIAATPSESEWTMRPDVTVTDGYSVYANMNKALTLFEKWLPSKLSQLGFSFDQATLFTGNKLYDGQTCSGLPCSKSGLGELEGICKFNASRAYSATLSKDFGMYSSIQTAAHELGHNLGAQHDGEMKACSDQEQYIMAASPNALSASNFNNAFTFSRCSMWYFRNNLAKITMTGNGNCLLYGTPSPTFIRPPYFADYPGQQYSADQQCQDMYGSSSYYCAGGGSRDQTICQSMECWDPVKAVCYLTAEQRAYDGTKCGNNKWCMKGQCVYDPRSPTTPETCIYGDYKDRIQVYSGIKMSCYDMGRLEPHSCYLNRTAGDCCQTCARIRDQSKPTGCGYGDKNPDYCVSPIKKSTCYNPYFADTCCNSCNSFKSKRVGCEYGDKSDGCPANTCYQSGTSCCETCQRLYDSRYPGCEFGDKAEWCPYHIKGPENCERESDAANCCRTCAPYLKNRGANQVCNDKAPWCSSIPVGQCYEYGTASTCCNTCSRYLRSK